MNLFKKADGPLDAPTCSASLTRRQISILEHTVNRAAGGRYCGGGEDMNGLVDMELMLYIGTPVWCPDPFYAITDKGRAALISSQNAKSAGTDASEKNL